MRMIEKLLIEMFASKGCLHLVQTRQVCSSLIFISYLSVVGISILASVPQTWRTKPLRVSALLTNKLGADTSEPTIAFILKFNVKLRGPSAAYVGIVFIAKNQVTFLKARLSNQG